ncbi:MAG: HPF/RaiA family ribosome-associated protein [Candidatus Babeliales bacterium]
MEKKITFRGMDHSQVMEDYINQQIKKIEKILEHEREPIYLEIFLDPSKIHAHHKVHILVKTPRYYLNSDYEGPDFYDVLDRVIDTMYRQIITKRKELEEKERKDTSYHGA